MILHLLGLPHTVTDAAHSHCAYTGKVLRFPAMMKPLGYEVIHYGAGDAEVDCEHVSIMTREEQDDLRGHNGSDPKRFVGDDGNTDSRLYKEFNRRLGKQLANRVRRDSGHLVLLPFGHAHWQAVQDIPDHQLVESGIGYPDLYAHARHRIFESFAWLHWHFGKAGRNEGYSYEWVIPNYFDPGEWDFNSEGQPGTVVFFGRLCQAKGLDTVWEMAKHRPDLHFILCGQGDPERWLTLPNIEYRPPISGRARSDLLGAARAVLMPTRYIEPFGGVAVEAQLCGTPVLASPWGAFPETIEDGRTGFLCHTLGDWLAALDRTLTLGRPFIRERAVTRYSMGRVGPKYDRAFRQIADLWATGWHTLRSTLGPVKVSAPEEVPAPQGLRFNWIWTGTGWCYGYYLAIATAVKLHPKATFTLWTDQGKVPPTYYNVLKSLGVRHRTFPADIVVADNLPGGGATRKDVLQWRLAEREGGAFFDLDTIVVAPLDGLFETDDLVVCQDVDDAQDYEHKWNNAMVIARAGSPAVRFTRGEMEARLKHGVRFWGDLGPVLLTDVVKNIRGARGVPFRVLGGYWGGEAHLLYTDGVDRPPQALMLHAFSASQRERWGAITPPWVERSSSPYATAVKEILSPAQWDPWDFNAWLADRGQHYRPMFEYLAANPVRRILEIGVFDGRNAAHMIRASAVREGDVSYWGVDVFESHTEEFRVREVSTGYHRPPPMVDVAAAISSRCPKATVHLEKGLSQDALPRLAGRIPPMDLIYIDGGHSRHTIWTDWTWAESMIAPGGVIFFDDVFTDRLDVGALFLTQKLADDGWDVQVTEPADQYPEFQARLLMVRHGSPAIHPFSEASR